MITNPDELKDLYLDTFKHRLRQRPVKPEFETILDLQEELFNLRLELAKRKKTAAWKLSDLENALKRLKDGKCRDPDGLIREIFKEEVIGDDLKKSLLVLLNKTKASGILPCFMRKAISVQYIREKGRLLISIRTAESFWSVSSGLF